MRIALALGLATALAGQTLSAQQLTGADRDAFRAEVRAYLMENPEVIMEAISVLQEREAQIAAQAEIELVAANADALFNDPSSFVGGNPDGDITIVEFLDYRCGYCKRAHPEMTRLLERDGNIRFIIKEYPILGEASVLASRYALAVRIVEGDEAYATVHDMLMSQRGDISQVSLDRLSSELGFDKDAIAVEMDSNEVADILQRNSTLGKTMQINGTPTFIVESELLRGYLPLDQMQQLVRDLRG